MPEKPIMHGMDHRPGGMDPAQPGAWIYVNRLNSPAWNSGTVYNPGDSVGDGIFNYLCTLGNIGFNPGVTSGWPTYWTIREPVFLNGFQNQVGSKVPMRFRISFGRYNVLDRLTGDVDTYSDHQLELEAILGNINGLPTSGVNNNPVCILPPAYRKQYDVRISNASYLWPIIPTVPNGGVFLVFLIKSDGTVHQGVPVQ